MEEICGNCNSCDHKAWLCDWEEADGTHRSVTADTPGCEDWELLRLSDEERLEGLEQLAKEMLRDQALMAFTARKEGAWETVEWIEGFMKESRKRLAALGVSLDD